MQYRDHQRKAIAKEKKINLLSCSLSFFIMNLLLDKLNHIYLMIIVLIRDCTAVVKLFLFRQCLIIIILILKIEGKIIIRNHD